MKRKLLVLAVAGAFAAPAMAADVSVYGAANASVDITNDGAAAPLVGRSANKVSSNESYIGFKASHDLGGGMSVMAQVESGIALDGTATTPGAGGAPAMMGSKLAGRDTFVGLAGGFGTVLAGTHDTPYKMATRSMDVFANTIADNRSLSDHDVRLGNVLAYVSPKFSNTTIAGAVVMGAENGAAGNQTKGSAFSLAAMYGAGPINASAAYQTVTAGSVGTGSLANALGAAGTKSSAFKVGVGYAADQFGVNAVIERPTQSVPGAASVSGTNLYVGAKYNVTSAGAIKLAYGKLGNTAPAGAVNTNGASQISFGYDHSLDKSTSVYVLYTKLNNDKGALRGLGQTPDGEITGATNGGLGSSPSAISAGLKYAF